MAWPLEAIRRRNGDRESYCFSAGPKSCEKKGTRLARGNAIKVDDASYFFFGVEETEEVLWQNCQFLARRFIFTGLEKRDGPFRSLGVFLKYEDVDSKTILALKS